ncbi:MAG: cation-translocating P-type ATPase [Bacteroidota bacterium]
MEKIAVKRIELLVEGMECTNCALGISKQLDRMGYEGVSVNFSSGEVVFDASAEGDVEKAVDKINSMGYQVLANLSEGETHVQKGLSGIEKKFWFSLIFTLPLLTAMFLPFHFLHNGWLQLVLATPVFIVGLYHFGRSGFQSLRAGVPNMDVLILLGSTASFVYSLIGLLMNMGHNFLFFETSASIITLIFLGNMLEHKAVRRTTSAIDDLVKLQKVIAHRIESDEHNNETIVDIEAVRIRRNDLLLINSGERVPADGVIYWGGGSFDEAMISGESLPVEKSEGGSVIGGTVLLSGSCKIKATAIGKQAVLGQIIDMVKNAQMDKPALQTLADRISAVFVPVVVIISIATFALSFWLAGVGFQDALMRCIAVLVIACPCALGLAIPTAVVVGVGRVAKQGILIKGASTIQKLIGVKRIVFDKTGTLTTGNFKISSMNAVGVEKEYLESVLLSVEKFSAHPIARAVSAELSHARPFAIKDAEEQKGMGMTAADDQGNTFSIGSYRMARALTGDSSHNLYVLRNGLLIGTVDIQDEVRAEAADVLSYLRSKGIKTILLSGDGREKCDALAKLLPFDEIYSEKLPAEKLAIIGQLGEKEDVAMVGDGINDAPALAKATVGISMSNATQVAIQSAQVILLKGNLNLLSKAYSISENTLTIIKQNLFWAFFYNVIAIPVAAMGFLSPMIAAASMALSDVIVVLNSLRLKSKKLDA